MITYPLDDCLKQYSPEDIRGTAGLSEATGAVAPLTAKVAVRTGTARYATGAAPTLSRVQDTRDHRLDKSWQKRGANTALGVGRCGGRRLRRQFQHQYTERRG